MEQRERDKYLQNYRGELQSARIHSGGEEDHNSPNRYKIFPLILPTNEYEFDRELYARVLRRKNKEPKNDALYRVQNYDERRDVFVKRDFARHLHQLRALERGMNENLEKAAVVISKYQLTQ